jgi:F0F1-type ATP synthase assembly protein I
MTTQRKGFWRGFTWKRFLRMSLLVFVITTLFVLMENYFTKKQPVSEILSLSETGKIVLRSVIMGLVLAIWHEPGLDDR